MKMESSAIDRYAIVTGGNKGIGYGICKKLASKGIMVILTARNEKRGLEAVQSLKEFGVSDFVVFHQLDVTDPSSVASLADFIKTQFGRLDILVNNAGVPPGKVNGAALFRKVSGEEVDWDKIVECNYEMSKACVETNYFGAVRVSEALLPLLHLSMAPTIVNVTSSIGLLKYIKNEWAKAVFSNMSNLTTEKLEEVVMEFMKDYKEGSLEAKGWPTIMPANVISKTALNVYTKMLAHKYPHFRVNSVHPGFVKTDLTQNYGYLTVEEASEYPVNLALLPHNGPSGFLFDKDEQIPLE
ncbi:(+)-neomenthol dehydrogenase-like [Senna tora]|uniref:(+)-neomenthol dehydrogenase-like n=1 Tax=Senna tora TaxID=362788 RepID=A0A834TNT9_9FABA|nr:(+)-neomenthol dehydrogenase-like [Senna tora]